MNPTDIRAAYQRHQEAAQAQWSAQMYTVRETIADYDNGTDTGTARAFAVLDPTGAVIDTLWALNNALNIANRFNTRAQEELTP